MLDQRHVPAVARGQTHGLRRSALASGNAELGGVVFNQASMAIEAAARTALAAVDLWAGRLIRPFDLRLPASYAYYIVCPPAFADRLKVRTMRDWLLADASDDATRLETLRGSKAEQLA